MVLERWRPPALRLSRAFEEEVIRIVAPLPPSPEDYGVGTFHPERQMYKEALVSSRENAKRLI